jgi:hypothetical protein
MSWLFSQALVEAFSEASSLDGELSAQLNVMPTAHPFWRNDKMMDSSRLSRFGLTLRLLTADRGEALLTSYRAAFLAKTSASQDQETDSAAPAADSGERWRGSFARFDRTTSSWRTPQCSFLEDSDEFLETWPRWGAMRNGECYLRPTLGPTTCERGSGFLPTPVAVDTGSYFNRSASAGAAKRPTLGAMAKYDLWPTPTATLGTNGGRVTPSKAREGGTLIEALSARMFPTPTATNTKAHHMRGADKGKDREPRSYGAHGQLNPTWVEWLMGWPLGWTGLQPLEMDKFREWQRQHSGCCEPDSSHS